LRLKNIDFEFDCSPFFQEGKAGTYGAHVGGDTGMLVSFGSPSRRCQSGWFLVSFGSPLVTLEFFPLSFKICVTDRMFPIIGFVLCFS
jgi:hypothetical protein